MGRLDSLEARYGAGNYKPLPVTLVRGEGIHVWDEDGRRYLDMLGAYSAASFGHCHPRLVAALTEQARRLDTVSRAYFTERLGPFLARACELTGMDKALPANGGAEAVETALKAARKWAYKVKGVANDRAEIIAADGNFHGRTITIVGFSSVPQYRDGFGPFAPGFTLVPFGDPAALEAAITPNTAAFLIEPIQGEGGIVVPPAGYLAQAARICRAHDVLLICDEVQTGLGRTGRLLACQHDGVVPDGVILGKALGGGLLPVSLFLARREVMDVFTPGDHGSTFGGNPIAAAVGLAALETLVEERLVERAARLGSYLFSRLAALSNPLIREVRGRGLLAGIEFDASRIPASLVVERLLRAGILTKETNRNTLRLAPPFVIGEAEIDWAIDRIAGVLAALADEIVAPAAAR
ncbi:MAG: ornithine--oxo-acid transaminase [Hyphomicrobiales bacterium]|nr:ornithine--oxo-acid transaminase [Hyphomicrobiales bacterium]